jgi:hypothetical protein
MTISRRKFLRDASMGAAAVGTAAAWAPGLAGLASSAAPSEASVVSSLGSVASVEGPVVAHVIDASSGTVAVYHGTQEVIVHSPSLVSALHSALH